MTMIDVKDKISKGKKHNEIDFGFLRAKSNLLNYKQKNRKKVIQAYCCKDMKVMIKYQIL